jgi:hypothetical protein
MITLMLALSSKKSFRQIRVSKGGRNIVNTHRTRSVDKTVTKSELRVLQEMNQDGK